MLPNKPRTLLGASARNKQELRLLTSYDKPQPCNAPDCRKRAVGEDRGKVYCAEHFNAAVRKRWK